MKVEDKNIHVVLDIETLGTKSGSAIVQIGAVCLNPNLPNTKKAEGFLLPPSRCDSTPNLASMPP